jgi:hypothetical protein
MSTQSYVLQHMELSFKTLNVRIARLAIALGVSLNNEEDLARVMHHSGAQVPPQIGAAIPSCIN